MSSGRIIGLCLAWLVGGAPAHAALSANKQHELDYLLAYTRNSACTFDSRGAQLDSQAASAYFHRQYRLHSERINNIEEFIQVAAAKSQQVGQYSMVECQGGGAMRTMDWLLRALSVYRLQRRY